MAAGRPIGEARLYLAESPAAAGIDETAESVRAALASVTGDARPPLPRVIVAPGLAVWEAAAADQARAPGGLPCSPGPSGPMS